MEKQDVGTRIINHKLRFNNGFNDVFASCRNYRWHTCLHFLSFNSNAIFWK